MIGLLVGGEGVVAVLLPIWVGRISDRTTTKLGRRLPFLLATAPVGAAALGLLPFAPSLWLMSLEVLAFYLAYYTYFSPYRALYPDLVSPEATARAQGIQGVFQGAGIGLALVGGGLLLDRWEPAPYLAAGAILLLATWAVTVVLRRQTRSRESMPPGSESPASEVVGLLKGKSAIRDFIAGNALLTLGLSGLKSFVVLWLTQGLGKSMSFTAGAMAVVAFGTVVGALVAGKLADKHGPGRVLCIALVLFGGGLIVGSFTTSVPILGVAFPIIALSGGAAFALPYAFLLRIAPEGRHGIVAGVFDASSGVGTLLGPALTGVAVDVFGRFFPAHGYAAMWPVLSIAVLASAAILRREAGGANVAAGKV